MSLTSVDYEVIADGATVVGPTRRQPRNPEKRTDGKSRGNQRLRSGRLVDGARRGRWVVCKDRRLRTSRKPTGRPGREPYSPEDGRGRRDWRRGTYGIHLRPRDQDLRSDDED